MSTFPSCPASEVAGIELTRQGRRNAELMRVEERRDGRGFPYYWLMFQRGAFEQEEGTDLAALGGEENFDHPAAGSISPTTIRVCDSRRLLPALTQTKRHRRDKDPS